MRKFINFAKKTLLIITAGVFVAFTALLIIISCLPKGSKYEWKYSVMGINMEVSYTFDGDKVTVDTYILGAHDSASTEYKINKGELYLVNLETNEWEYAGEINAYEIVMKANAEETGIGNMEVVLECKANKTIRTIAIVFMCVSGVAAGACIALYFLDKKGMLKFVDNMASASGNDENTVVLAGNYIIVEEPRPEIAIEPQETTETVEPEIAETEEVLESQETEEKPE